MEPTTREKYTYYLNAHILPEFGPMRMMDILPEHVRAWITKMQANGASAWTIQYGKYAILNSIFTTAVRTRNGPPGGPVKRRQIALSSSASARRSAVEIVARIGGTGQAAR